VDRGGADRTSDGGWGAVVEAADGEQGRRRRSGEQWRSGQGKIEGKNDVQQPGRVLGKQRKSSGSRRGGSRAQVGAGASGARGSRGGARAGVKQRGGRGADQHEVGRAAALQRDDVWSVGRQEVAREVLRW
jgi:hypothetical protein